MFYIVSTIALLILTLLFLKNLRIHPNEVYLKSYSIGEHDIHEWLSERNAARYLSLEYYEQTFPKNGFKLDIKLYAYLLILLAILVPFFNMLFYIILLFSPLYIEYYEHPRSIKIKNNILQVKGYISANDIVSNWLKSIGEFLTRSI